MLDHLTRPQVELYLEAITRRYMRQSEALKQGSTSSAFQEESGSIDELISQDNLSALQGLNAQFDRGTG